MAKLHSVKNYSHYLPDTKKKLKRLKRIIGGRNVGILMSGYSLTTLKLRIGEIADLDIFYATVNNFSVIENSILKPVDKRLSAVMCAAQPNWWVPEITEFLDREDDNVFIAERSSFSRGEGFDLGDMYDRWGDKMLFFTSYWNHDEKPTEEYPLHFLAQNSLSVLLFLMLIGKAKNVVLFGADGGKVGNKPIYFEGYSDREIATDGYPIEYSIARDNYWFKEFTPAILDRIRRVHGVNVDNVFNCSTGSHIDVFLRISYDDAFKLLRG